MCQDSLFVKGNTTYSTPCEIVHTIVPSSMTRYCISDPIELVVGDDVSVEDTRLTGLAGSGDDGGVGGSPFMIDSRTLER